MTEDNKFQKGGKTLIKVDNSGQQKNFKDL